MHPARTVEVALRLAARGECAGEIGRKLGVPRSTVRDWMAGSKPRRRLANACSSCGAEHRLAELGPSYVYLLGMYLGDGYIAPHRRGVYGLRISLDVRYPRIIDSCSVALREAAPSKRVGTVDYGTWIELCCWSKTWPCLFPQHGPGKKHERMIELADWQQRLADRWPEQLLRGLIESDGCRFQNTGRCGWSWPRYFFTNKSDGIRATFCSACDRLGIHWTASGAHRIYVSRKADVARLDEFIGAKG